ncbi:hypothetical protein KP614_00480 [Treponema denticola]
MYTVKLTEIAANYIASLDKNHDIYELMKKYIKTDCWITNKIYHVMLVD